MSELRGRSGSGIGIRGGVLGYPLERVYREVAYLSCKVHWTHDELMHLDHAERRRWVEEVAKLEETSEQQV
jgi:hypothetical protein